MQEPEYKKDIVANLRGYYLTEIITALGKNNLIETLINKKKINFKNLKNKISKKH